MNLKNFKFTLANVFSIVIRITSKNNVKFFGYTVEYKGKKKTVILLITCLELCVQPTCFTTKNAASL